MFYGLYKGLIRPILFRFDPEKVHEFTMSMLKTVGRSPLAFLLDQCVEDKPVEVMGLRFKNPVGLAAGLDKDGIAVDGLGRMGFGFVEVGTVTPRPQPGNPKKRLFRLVPVEGIINRMGFNNEGVDQLLENVSKRKWNGVLGINIGKNKTTPLENALDDYLACMEKVYSHADYITVNISSPNTPDLRKLQFGESLDALLLGLKKKQAELHKKHAKYVPLAVKIAPDVTDDELKGIAESLLKAKIDAVIATNTTISRDAVYDMPHAYETGGLSGKPLFTKSTEVIRKLKAIVGDKMPIIGVGGIDSAAAARDKLAAGASLVQIYSGFIYQGPKVIKDIVHGL